MILWRQWSTGLPDVLVVCRTCCTRILLAIFSHHVITVMKVAKRVGGFAAALSHLQIRTHFLGGPRSPHPTLWGRTGLLVTPCSFRKTFAGLNAHSRHNSISQGTTETFPYTNVRIRLQGGDQKHTSLLLLQFAFITWKNRMPEFPFLSKYAPTAIK